MSDDVAVVRAVFEQVEAARRDGTLGTPLDIVAEDFELVPASEVPGAQRYHGAAGYAEFLQGWTEAFETWSHELERVVDAGDGRVVASARQWGVGRESGVPVDLHFGIVFELRDGLLFRVRLYMTPAEAFAAVGLAG
ncbi:MAG TPA: nuclear transport factor 2 family protein [Thermoleophilaceae bacterium]|nr:nuclear transport factor 2 family protein [Thermoleophilaceae bacterium]